MVVYVVPTRALGNDVLRRVAPPLEALGIAVGLRHGDAPRKKQAHRAAVTIITPESLDAFKRRMRKFCRDRLPSYKVPVHIEFTDEDQFGARMKKMRGDASANR